MTTFELQPEYADDLSDADYRRICNDLLLRQGVKANPPTMGSWRDLVAGLNSTYSPAWWSRFARRDISITRQAKKELRRAWELPPLPPTLGDLVTENGSEVVVTPAHNALLPRYHGHRRRRVATKAIRVHPELWERLSADRADNGMKWDEYLDTLLWASDTLCILSTKEETS